MMENILTRRISGEAGKEAIYGNGKREGKPCRVWKKAGRGRPYEGNRREFEYF